MRRNPEGFMARRLREREREVGLVMRDYYERRQRPPEALVREHRALWVARSRAIAADYDARRAADHTERNDER